MHYSVLVVDDFYEDPHAIRNFALGFDYPEPKKKPNFPGRNSNKRLLVDGIDDIVSQLVQEKVVGSTQDYHGFVRSSLAADDVDRKYTVHLDRTVYWSGILYLTAPEHCQGGTDFYRHIETDTDRAPIFPGEAEKYGAENGWQWSDEIIQRDSNDMSKWEHTMRVPMRFNRLILIRPWFWHTAGPSFGDSLENGRLVQLFFFQKAP